MRPSLRVFASLIFTILLFSCSSKDMVEIIEFSPQGETKELTTFRVEFDRALAPDSLTDKWIDGNFIQFNPAISGKYKWIDAKTLIFSPDHPLEPIQKYTANVTADVLFNSLYETDFDEYDFNTPDFDVLKTEFFWTQLPNQTHKVSIQANVYFNYPVSPDQLKNYIKVFVESKETSELSIVSDKSSEMIAVNLGEFSQANSNQKIVLKIKKGLSSTIGKKPLEDDREFTYDLEALTRLAVTDVYSEFEGVRGVIVVTTTQMVNSERVREFITLNPPLDYDVSVFDNTIRLEGNFADYQSIDLKIAKGLPGVLGGELEFDYQQMITFVNLNPAINFKDKQGSYLLRGGEENLEIMAVNVEEVEITVSQVFENNLVHFLGDYGYYFSSDDSYYYSPYINVSRYGKMLYEEKLSLPRKENWKTDFTVNINKALQSEFKGLFVIQINSKEDRWIQDTKIFAVSDLGIIAKRSHNSITVFVNSITSTDAVESAEVKLFSSNNQLLAEGFTNKNGAVTLNKFYHSLEEFSPQLILVKNGDDFNFINLYGSRVETSRFDVGGKYDYYDYNAFIYGDRNLYRPGERVNISGIVRDRKINVVKDVPVFIKVYTPTGKLFDEFKKILNQQGSFELSFEVPEYSQTGEYRVDLFTANERLIGNYKFSIEDFVPDKIRVILKNNPEIASSGQSITTSIDAEFLFGAKAADMPYQAEIQLRHKPFISKQFPRFTFSNSSIKDSFIKNQLMDGKLDSEGHAEVVYQIPHDVKSSGLITAYQFVSVFDLTGRPVNRVSSAEIYPNRHYIGIRSDRYYVGTNDEIKFQVIAVDQNDKAVEKLNVLATLVKYEWQTVLKQDHADNYYYTSEKKEVIKWNKNITIEGEPEDISFSVPSSGQYELRINDLYYGEGYQYSGFYAYGWGSSTASSFQVDREGRVDIVLDKEKYEPGDEAKILFMTPFEGKMLVTLERDSVFYYNTVDVKDRSFELTLDIKEEYLPNVYVSATLFKPHTLESATPYFVGYGYKSLQVEDSDNLLEVEIESPEKIKPNTKQKITINTKSKKDIFITLAAVDEGILQLKNYQTPDPYSFMYAKRALQVDGYDIYKYLLPEIVTSSPGGDDFAAQLKKRTNPITTKRFKLLSYWSGIRRTDSSGEVEITLDIPQFNGEVRLMALAYDESSFGSAESFMKVADDVIIESEIPRFLSINDKLEIPVTAINTTNKNIDIDLSMSVNGPLNITSDDKAKVTINPNSTFTSNFYLNVGSKIGKGSINIESKGDAKVSEKIDIPIRPVSPLVVESGSGILTAVNEMKINLSGEFVEGTQQANLVISNFPGVRYAKTLKSLIGFPYGCLEQTVSKLFPQLYFEDIAKLAAPELYKTTNPIYNIKEGIRKIEAMQRYDGSFLYWPSGTTTNEWTNVYAAHFLLEARKAGFDVNANVINSMLSYISKRVHSKETIEYVKYDQNRRTVVIAASREIPYGLYVLALSGKGDLATMNYYKARLHLLPGDSRFFLAGAYALMGKWQAAYEIIPSSFSPVKTERTTGGSFNSSVKANAIILNLLLDVDPENVQIPNFIKYLNDNAKDIYSTQDKAFVFMALGKSAKAASESKLNVKIEADGKVVGEFSGKDINIDLTNYINSEIKLIPEGKGKTYFYWSVEGVKTTSEFENKDSNLKVRRRYFDYRSGTEITNNTFRQGDLIVCKFELTGVARDIENIVISDLLPAGFEIENPRLMETQRLTSDSNNKLLPVEYLDIRDDRLLLFTSLRNQNYGEFKYLIRVVNRGEFHLAPITADAMYDREYNSINGGGIIKVTGR
ncbi:MAG: MG2 domain-containing protein [Melioribacteraceae bacterium]|nr:hypothetical protein [Melioribacteraceae bacterium]MDD3557631.1 MG2 domain-containing protein [Melioribacteraceae bacterium]